MKAIGRPEKFVAWVKTCISTPKYTLALNRGLVGYFERKKGVRLC